MICYCYLYGFAEEFSRVDETAEFSEPVLGADVVPAPDWLATLSRAFNPGLTPDGNGAAGAMIAPEPESG